VGITLKFPWRMPRQYTLIAEGMHFKYSGLGMGRSSNRICIILDPPGHLPIRIGACAPGSLMLCKGTRN